MHKTRNLFLVEHYTHVKNLLRMNMRDKGEWIALGPGAMAAFREEGILYKIPEDFYSNEEMGALCLAHHDKLEKFCNYIDEHLNNKHPELKKWGIRPFLFHMFPLTMLIDSMVSRIFQLRNILNAYPGCKVWVYRTPYYLWGMFDIDFSNREALWGHIFSLPGWDHEVKFLEEPKAIMAAFSLRKTLVKIKNSLFQITKEFIKSFPSLNNIVFNIKSGAFKRLASWPRRNRGTFMLVHGGIYDWKHTLSLLQEKGYGTFFANNRLFKPKTPNKGKVSTEHLENLIKSEAGLMSVFEVCGISFYPLLKERLAWVFEGSFSGYKSIIPRFEKIIRDYNIKAIFTANTPTFMAHAQKQIARYFQVPVIHWQHGFMFAKNGRITQLNEFNDMMTSDVVFTFGEESARAHELHIDKFPAKVISIGSSSLDKIWEKNKKIKEKFKKTILYVTTNYSHNWWYNGFYPPFSDRYLLKDQLMILELLRQMTYKYNTRVTVKLPKESAFNSRFIDEFSSSFRMVVDEASFVELMDKNHIIIIDSPTTTTLEAVATKKPVFVLMKHVGYSDSARKALERRAICTDTSHGLIGVVERYLDHGAYHADVNNDEFLRLWGTYLNDGESDRRAVGEVLKIINRNQSSRLRGDNSYTGSGVRL